MSIAHSFCRFVSLHYEVWNRRYAAKPPTVKAVPTTAPAAITAQVVSEDSPLVTGSAAIGAGEEVDAAPVPVGRVGCTTSGVSTAGTTTVATHVRLASVPSTTAGLVIVTVKFPKFVLTVEPEVPVPPVVLPLTFTVPETACWLFVFTIVTVLVLSILQLYSVTDVHMFCEFGPVYPISQVGTAAAG